MRSPVRIPQTILPRDILSKANGGGGDTMVVVMVVAGAARVILFRAIPCRGRLGKVAVPCGCGGIRQQRMEVDSRHLLRTQCSTWVELSSSWW
jgi:hypothetical protein